MEDFVIHNLKILPEYYQAVIDGTKTFEIRKNDRNFQVGDIVTLREWANDKFTGRVTSKVITYITDYAQQDNYVVMSIR